MEGKKVCIYASNLHYGGGVQVATSFIYELSKMAPPPYGFHVFVSSIVHKNLVAVGVDSSIFPAYEVFDVYGLEGLSKKVWARFLDYDLVFTVFGPNYFPVQKGIHVVGFAQPWIIYPDNEVYQGLSLIDKLRVRGKFFLQSVFYKRADHIVVELEHVRKALAIRGIGSLDDISVVHNCISSIYSSEEKWDEVKIPCQGERFSIGFIGRDYPHKNTNYLLSIKQLLRKRYGLTVNVYVTMTEREWIDKSPAFRSEVINVGELTVAQCPSFYKAMDAIVFPSLLECFSATPLEAMAMGKPLLASDRQFVRDVCGDYAYYFDPLEPSSVLDGLVKLVRADHEALISVEKAQGHALSFSSAEKRAFQYINIMGKMLRC